MCSEVAMCSNVRMQRVVDISGTACSKVPSIDRLPCIAMCSNVEMQCAVELQCVIEISVGVSSKVPQKNRLRIHSRARSSPL